MDPMYLLVLPVLVVGRLRDPLVWVLILMVAGLAFQGRSAWLVILGGAILTTLVTLFLVWPRQPSLSMFVELLVISAIGYGKGGLSGRK